MKVYKNYLTNQALRKKYPNIRKIRDGKPIAYWGAVSTKRTFSAF